MNSYRDLKVWQSAMNLAELVYALSRDFPSSELYGLSNQRRRAAVSVAANKELETHILLAQRLGFAQSNQVQPILTLCDESGRMLRALLRSTQEKANREG